MKKQPSNAYWTIERLHDLVKDRYEQKMTLDAIAAKHNKHYQSVQHALKCAEARGIKLGGYWNED